MSLSSVATRPSPVFPRGPWQLAVFDLDGTLVDTQEDLLDSLGEALGEELGGEGFGALARARARAALHLGMPAMVFAALGEAEKDGKRMQVLQDRYLEVYATRIARKSRPYPGVREALYWLRERGVVLALCSNKPVEMSRLLLQTLDLASWFPVIVGPESTGWPKPHPEPLCFAAFQSNIARSRTVLIGDSAIDSQCAATAGISCWMYRGGYDPAAAARATLQFGRFDELCQSTHWFSNSRRRRSSVP